MRLGSGPGNMTLNGPENGPENWPEMDLKVDPDDKPGMSSDEKSCIPIRGYVNNCPNAKIEHVSLLSATESESWDFDSQNLEVWIFKIVAPLVLPMLLGLPSISISQQGIKLASCAIDVSEASGFYHPTMQGSPPGWYSGCGCGRGYLRLYRIRRGHHRCRHDGRGRRCGHVWDGGSR